MVRVQEKLSSTINITSRVPQGSVVGPLLFVAFVNELPANFLSSDQLFADDCIVYREIISHEDIILLQTAENGGYPYIRLCRDYCVIPDLTRYV